MEKIIKYLEKEEKARIMYYIRNNRIKTYYNSNNQLCYDDTEYIALKNNGRANAKERNYQFLASSKKTEMETYLKDLTTSQLSSILYYDDALRDNGVIFYVDEHGKLSVNLAECLAIIKKEKYNGIKHKSDEFRRAYYAQKQREHRARQKQLAQPQ